MTPHPADHARTDAPASELVEALLGGDRPRAQALVLERLEATGSFSELVDTLVTPAMREVGRRWADGEIGVSDEHRATAVLQTVLAHAFAESEAADPGQRRALVACVEGNEHALGARSLADALELAGWEVRYLGSDADVETLVDAVEAFEPDVVGLSVSLDHQEPAVGRTVERLRARLGDEAPRILLGGSVPEGPSRAQRCGADAWLPGVVDALEALA